MRIDAISTGSNPPHDINVIVEVPIGGEPVKYEMDKASGTLFVDRILYTAMRYPGNYGFVPHTLCEDGDARVVVVRLTVDGRRAVAATRERLRTAQRTVYENLTAAEQRQASVLLSRLSEAIDEL